MNQNSQTTNQICSLRSEENSALGSSRRQSRRAGSLLIIVLVTIVVLSLAAYTFTALMQTEEEASRLVTRQIQSKYLADSGMDFVRLFLSNSQATIREKGGIWDNPQYFQAIPVAVETSDPNMIGYFSVASSSIDEEGTPEGQRFGLVDESTKINLNTLPYAEVWLQTNGGQVRDILMTLPEMNEEIADAILNWIDADDEPRDYDVEAGYYESLSPAYEPKNGPLDSLDELLLVRGVTPTLLFGLDTNRNGLLDPEEMIGTDVSAVETEMHLGWANYLTLYSNESNLTGEGLERINVNSDDAEQLYDDLKSAYDDQWANYIIYYRFGVEEPVPTPPTDATTLVDASLVPPDFAALEQQLATAGKEPRKLNSIVELVGKYIDVSIYQTNALTVNIESPVQGLFPGSNMPFTLPNLMANLTTNEGPTIPGRINIMQASRQVMLGIPTMTEELVDQIIQRRGTDYELDDPDGADMNRKYETWLMAELLVQQPQMEALMPFICTGGDVYRAEIVGYFADGIATSRAEVVFDTTVPIPRVLNWRNKSHLRASFSIEALGTNIIE